MPIVEEFWNKSDIYNPNMWTNDEYFKQIKIFFWRIMWKGIYSTSLDKNQQIFDTRFHFKQAQISNTFWCLNYSFNYNNF